VNDVVSKEARDKYNDIANPESEMLILGRFIHVCFGFKQRIIAETIKAMVYVNTEPEQLAGKAYI
jgi:hypothetical protein